MIERNQPHSISFFNWKLEERMALLNQAHIASEVNVQAKTITPLYSLSSGQEEVFNFVRDPICAIKFWILDRTLCKLVLDLHYDFWVWKNGYEKEETKTDV